MSNLNAVQLLSEKLRCLNASLDAKIAQSNKHLLSAQQYEEHENPQRLPQRGKTCAKHAGFQYFKQISQENEHVNLKKSQLIKPRSISANMTSTSRTVSNSTVFSTKTTSKIEDYLSISPSPKLAMNILTQNNTILNSKQEHHSKQHNHDQEKQQKQQEHQQQQQEKVPIADLMSLQRQKCVENGIQKGTRIKKTRVIKMNYPEIVEIPDSNNNENINQIYVMAKSPSLSKNTTKKVPKNNQEMNISYQAEQQVISIIAKLQSISETSRINRANESFFSSSNCSCKHNSSFSSALNNGNPVFPNLLESIIQTKLQAVKQRLEEHHHSVCQR